MKFLIVLQAQKQLTGLYEAPTGMNGKIEISERGKVRAWSKLQCDEALLRKIYVDIT